MILSVRKASESHYRNMRDEDLVSLSHNGHSQATEHLICKYRYLVENKARTYYLVGADHDDVVQEGMIGLFKAIRDFQFGRLSRFRAFAELCVTRQIITAIKMSTRHKHSPMNSYVSLQQTIVESDGDTNLLDRIPDDNAVDPQKVVIEQRERADLQFTIEHRLSPLETEVLKYYLQGSSYREISETMKCGTKCVDNALQRIKRKVGHILEPEQ